MTAEVAIINKSAVALAADSLMTISEIGAPSKTYNVNKLFTLSKYAPVGVMVYGNAELIGVPWETIVKAFREELGGQIFPRIDEYLGRLIAFLHSHRGLFSDESQQNFVRQVTAGVFRQVCQMVENELRDHPGFSEGDVLRLTETIGSKYRAALQNRNDLIGLDNEFRQQLALKYAPQFQSEIESQLGFIGASETLRSLFAELAVLSLTKEETGFAGILSGVVIAGFGGDEYFPVVRSIHVLGMACDRLLYHSDSTSDTDITPSGPSAKIIPFAQRDVIDLFLQGIDPGLMTVISEYLESLLDGIPVVFREVMQSPNTSRALIPLADELDKFKSASQAKFHEKIEEFIYQNHVVHLLNVIEVLPKEELAALAESLVSITSIKRKMSLQVETVGGPIDVALISKGDGFVWIKRKHYFQPELNPQFAFNYFRISGGVSRDP